MQWAVLSVSLDFHRKVVNLTVIFFETESFMKSFLIKSSFRIAQIDGSFPVIQLVESEIFSQDGQGNRRAWLYGVQVLPNPAPC